MMANFRNLFKAPPKPQSIEQTAAAMGKNVAWAESQLYTKEFPKYNPDDLIGRKGHGVYRSMMIDEQVKAVVKFKRDAITSRDYFFELKDDRLNDTETEKRIKIYEEMLKQVSGSFEDGLNCIMKAVWQGFSITEKIIDIFEYGETPYLGLRKLAPKPFHSFKFYTDEFGSIEKLEQEFDMKTQELDLHKFVYLVQNPDMDQHYGQSELREAYRSWYSKDIIIRLYNVFMERLAGGFMTITPNEGTTINNNTPAFAALQDVLNSMQTATGILLPGGVTMELHHPAATDQFEKAIVLHDLAIAKALLVPNLLGISHTGQTGAFAQSQTQVEAFLWTLNADAKRLEDAVNEQIFDPLSTDNFADGIGPKFKFKPISEQKKLEIIKTWKDLVSGKAVEASDTDEAHVRELLDFPDKGEPLKSQDAIVPPVPGDPTSDPDETLKDNPEEEDPANADVKDKKFSRVLRAAAFHRAERRVAFTVIDRKTTQLLERHTETIGKNIEDLIADASLTILEEDLGTPAGKRLPHELTLDTRLKARMRKSAETMLQDAWSLGLKHAVDEISSARKEQFKVKMARIEGNADLFLKSNGFRFTGSLTDEILKVIQAILANAIKYSWTPKETVRRVYDRMTLGGFVYAEANAEATGRTIAEVYESIGQSTKRDVHRVKTAIRTSTFESLNEARYSAFTDPELEGFVEALEYSAVLDSRTTEICSHLDGRVYPVGAAEWDSYRPPNHFNCRSVLVPVTVIDTEVSGKDHDKDSRWSKTPRVDPQTGFGSETG